MRKIPVNNKAIYRIIDANTNRLKEGLRVCEEVTRFVLNNKTYTLHLKTIRHQVDTIIRSLSIKNSPLIERDSQSDVGRKVTTKTEKARFDSADIFFANIQRVKESLRVLEEFTKLLNVEISMGFKELRYKIYEIEKKVYIIINPNFSLSYKCRIKLKNKKNN